MPSKKQLMQAQRNRIKNAIGAAYQQIKPDINPDKKTEQQAARFTLSRMKRKCAELAEQHKLYRLRIPGGETIGTYDILTEYADSYQLPHDNIQPL